jgi:hypothetical protein
MLTCNLIETMHNIWLQQLKKRGTSLYTMTCDNYVMLLNNRLYIDITCKEIGSNDRQSVARLVTSGAPLVTYENRHIERCPPSFVM